MAPERASQIAASFTISGTLALDQAREAILAACREEMQTVRKTLDRLREQGPSMDDPPEDYGVGWRSAMDEALHALRDAP